MGDILYCNHNKLCIKILVEKLIPKKLYEMATMVAQLAEFAARLVPKGGGCKRVVLTTLNTVVNDRPTL